MVERRLSRCHPVDSTLDPCHTLSFIHLRLIIPSHHKRSEEIACPPALILRGRMETVDLCHVCPQNSCQTAVGNDRPSAPTQPYSLSRFPPLSGPGHAFLPSRFLPIVAQRLTAKPKPPDLFSLPRHSFSRRWRLIAVQRLRRSSASVTAQSAHSGPTSRFAYPVPQTPPSSFANFGPGFGPDLGRLFLFCLVQRSSYRTSSVAPPIALSIAESPRASAENVFNCPRSGPDARR